MKMLKIRKIFSVILVLCVIFTAAGTAFAQSDSAQLQAVMEVIKDTRDSSHFYNVIEGFEGYNDMTAEEFLSFVKKYIIPEGNESVPSLYTEADYRITNATEEKDGTINVNVMFTCGKLTKKEWVTIKIPKLTGSAAVKSEDKERVEADKKAVTLYLQTVTVTNDSTKEKLLAGIQSAAVNGSTAAWSDDFEKREATEQWSGFLKGTLILKSNYETETLAVKKSIKNILPGKEQTENIPILDNSQPSESVSEATMGFTDVASTDYFAAAVKWAVERNITTGTSATTFTPNDTCTRAQILTFLWRASGSPKAEAENPFSDVNITDYYYDAAVWASTKGMVTGTKFEADTPCTRSATVMYLWQNAGAPEADAALSFSDVAAGSDYAAAVCWAVNNNVTSGTSDTTFSPSAICSRGQIVTFLFRAQ